MDGPPPAEAPAAPPGSFWATVTWPWGEGVMVVLVAPLLLFALAAAWDHTRDGRIFGALVSACAVPVFGVLWSLCRVLQAWAAWPSPSRWVRWVKVVVRFLSGPER